MNPGSEASASVSRPLPSSLLGPAQRDGVAHRRLQRAELLPVVLCAREARWGAQGP